MAVAAAAAAAAASGEDEDESKDAGVSIPRDPSDSAGSAHMGTDRSGATATAVGEGGTGGDEDEERESESDGPLWQRLVKIETDSVWDIKRMPEDPTPYSFGSNAYDTTGQAAAAPAPEPEPEWDPSHVWLRLRTTLTEVIDPARVLEAVRAEIALGQQHNGGGWPR